MKSIISTLCALLFAAVTLSAQAPLILNLADRETVSLDGEWTAKVDPFERGYYDDIHEPLPVEDSFFACSEFEGGDIINLTVPGEWNSQQERLYYYEGTMWYQTHFNLDRAKVSKRYFLHFGTVNYEATIGVNGHIAGTHEGGFTPFDIEISEYVKTGDNVLTIKVDNRRRIDAVPALRYDWPVWGGITRSVSLVVTPSTFVRSYAFYEQPGAKWNQLAGYIQIDGELAGRTAYIDIPELGVNKKVLLDEDGYGQFAVKTWHERWTPSEPKTHEVIFSYGDDKVKESIGFRTIQVEGGTLLINGTRQSVRRMDIEPEDDAMQMLSQAVNQGYNLVRLKGYPRSEQVLDRAEELGLMVWEELPICGQLTWSSKSTNETARSMTESLLTRDFNRACVVAYTIAGETPRTLLRTSFISKLWEGATSLDPTRVITVNLTDPKDELRRTIEIDASMLEALK